MDDDRLKIWIGFTKFLLGTFALGLVSIWINYGIQDRQIKINEQIRNSEITLKETAQENENLSKYISLALDKDLTRRRDFAKYFASVSKTEDAKVRWQSYVKFVENEIGRNLKKQKDLEEKYINMKKELRKLEPRYEKYARNEIKLSKELETIKDELKKLEYSIAEDTQPESKLSDEIIKYRDEQRKLDKQLVESIQSKDKRDIETKIQDIKIELALEQEEIKDLRSELRSRSVPSAQGEEKTKDTFLQEWGAWKADK